MSLNNSGQDTVEGFDKCANKKAVVPAVSPASPNPISVVNPNLKREYCILVLNSRSDVTLILGEPLAGKLGEGIPLIGKGSSCEIKKTNPYKGRISAISTGGAELAIVECERSLI